MREMWEERLHLLTMKARFLFYHNSMLYWRTVLHTVFLLHHLYLVVFATGINTADHPNRDINNMHKYKFCFLTGWNMAFQTTFLILAVTYDTLEWFDSHKGDFGAKIRQWRDVVYTGLVVPFTLFVTSIFWAVYFINRELIFPVSFEDVIPWWFSASVHGTIMVVIAAETLLQARREPTNFHLEISICLLFAFGYAAIYYSVCFMIGEWLYPFFRAMSFWHVCVYQISCWSSSYVFYSVQFPINRYIHGSTPGKSNCIKNK